MKLLLLLTLIISSLFAEFQNVIHSSVSTYYETKDYTGSKQKTSAHTYGVGADIHYKNAEYKFAYEDGKAITRKPPLSVDLETEKLFLRYAYTFDRLTMNLNYINILNDNLAITSHGKSYGFGLEYRLLKKFKANFTQYYTDYKDFNVHQSDLKLDYKMKINDVGVKLSSTTKYIKIDDENFNNSTKNAKDDYLTSGVKLGLNYQSYHFGAGAYFGKRTFAIMNEGFKIQHHAMEFDRTYAIGMGKKFSNFVIRAQYIYQRATELAIQNENVEVDIFRIIANYKF